MKKDIQATMMCAIGALALVSCEQPRVNERPLGMAMTYPHNAQQLNQGGTSGQTLLDDLDGSSSTSNTDRTESGTTGSNPGTTIGDLVGGGKPSTSPGNTGGVTGGASSPAASPSIPVAWPDPTDPTVVRSPYDRSKKIRITRPDGTRYSPGTVLWDPNYDKSEGKKFRVP